MTFLEFANNPWWLLTTLGPFGGVVTYYIYSLVYGRQHSERAASAGGSLFISAWLKEYGYWWLSIPTRVAVRHNITPTTITMAGFVMVASGCLATALGGFCLGGWLILVGSVADMLDGVVARQTGTCSDAGEFIDSIVDRYADIAVFMGLIVYYRGNPLALCLLLAALMGSVIVSYVRAKAESLGVRDTPAGPMQRAERAVYLGFAIYLSPFISPWTERPSAHPSYWPVLAVCAIIALFANASALQMSQYILRRLRLSAEKQKDAHPHPQALEMHS